MIGRPRVLIADDHPLVAQGLAALLAAECDVLAQVEDARELADALAEHRPDVLLLDLSMPNRNGLDVLPELRRVFPAVRILIVTMYADRTFAELAFELGADGFVTKEAPATELRAAIAAVLRGKRYLSPRVPRRGYRTDDSLRDRPALDRLTPRQREIVRLIGEGKSSAEMAAILRLSPRTIEFHRARAREALGIASDPSDRELRRFALMVRIDANRQPVATPPRT